MPLARPPVDPLAVLHLRRWSMADSSAVLELIDASGLTATAFADRHGIAPMRLFRCRSRLRAAQAVVSAPTPVRFLEIARPEPAPATLALQVGAVRIPVSFGFDPELLRAVVSALAALPC